jgi:hypothetical protein
MKTTCLNIMVTEIETDLLLCYVVDVQLIYLSWTDGSKLPSMTLLYPSVLRSTYYIHGLSGMGFRIARGKTRN